MKIFFENNRALVAKKRIMMIIMAVALIALPTMAQQDQWQSTSTMQGSGSTYSSQVTGVGATGVDNMATTTETYSPSPAAAGRRRAFDNPGEYGQGESPVGDALIPLLLCACMYLSVRVFLKRKRALKGE